MLKGTVNIKRWTLIDGVEVLTHESTEENLLNKSAVNSILFTTTVLSGGRGVAISSSTTAPSFEAGTLTGVLAIGGVNPSLSYRVVTDKTVAQPYYTVTYNARFVPPGSNRTINSIGLTDDQTFATTKNIFTHLLLSSPILQTTADIIDISYAISIRIQNNTSQALAFIFEEYAIANVGGDLTAYYNSNGQNFGFLAACVDSPYGTNLTVSANGDYDLGRGPVLSPITNTVLNTSSFLNTSSLHYGSSFFNSYTKASAVGVCNVARSIEEGGIFFSSFSNVLTRSAFRHALARVVLNPQILYVSAGTSYNTRLFIGQSSIPTKLGGTIPLRKSSNLSNVYSHNQTNTHPTQDTNNLANSTWRPNISQLTNVQDFPTEYILKVSQSGGLGVGTYKIYRAGFGGFTQNTRQSRADLFFPISIHSRFLNPTDTTFIYNHRFIYKWAESQNLFRYATFRRSAGVAIVDVTSTGVTEFKKYTQFTAMINDIAVNPSANTIWVATEAGLYNINTSTDTVTLVNADKCACVSVGLGGIAYAVFRDGLGNGRLSNSNSWTTALNMSGATINWNNIWRILVNPLSASNELMIYEGFCPKNTMRVISNSPIPSLNTRVHWCNSSGFVSTNVYTNTAGGGGPSDRRLTHEYFLLPNNGCIRVENNTWIFPGNTADAGIYLGEPRQFISSYAENGSLAQDIRLDALAANVGWSGWGNYSGSTINTSPSVPTGGGSTYVISNFGAATVYTTFNTNGVVCDLLTTKPTPASTTYSLNMLIGCHMSSSTTSTYTSLIRANIVEAGGSTTTVVNSSPTDVYTFSTNTLGFTAPNLFPANFAVTFDKRILFFDTPRFGTKYYTNPALVEPETDYDNYLYRYSFSVDGGIGYVSGIKNVQSDTVSATLLGCQEYGWNGSNWVEGAPNGKPLHTTTDALIDGLQISWTDLNPGNTAGLILNQYYNFFKITEPNTIVIEPGAPNLEVDNYVYLRKMNSDVITQNATSIVYAKQAPSGSTPNNLFYGLARGGVSVTINGVPANVVVGSTTPASPGTVNFDVSIDSGAIRFNAADVGQPVVISYNWLEKFHPTET